MSNQQSRIKQTKIQKTYVGHRHGVSLLCYFLVFVLLVTRTSRKDVFFSRHVQKVREDMFLKHQFLQSTEAICCLECLSFLPAETSSSRMKVLSPSTKIRLYLYISLVLLTISLTSSCIVQET